MPPVVLALPVHAPCTEAEYRVRIARGAVARSSAIQPGAACQGEVCLWNLPAPPSPLEVVGDPNWGVTGSCATGSVDWNGQGFSSATWNVAEAVPDLPRLAGFAAVPQVVDAERAVDEIGARVRTLLGYCDRIGCTATVRAAGTRLQRALAARGQPVLGPAAPWAPGESGRPEGWTARYTVGDSVLELAAVRVSEGGTAWVLRATSASDRWLTVAISADGPTSTNLAIGTAYLAYESGDGGPHVTASGPAVDLR